MTEADVRFRLNRDSQDSCYGAHTAHGFNAFASLIHFEKVSPGLTWDVAYFDSRSDIVARHSRCTARGWSSLVLVIGETPEYLG